MGRHSIPSPDTRLLLTMRLYSTPIWRWPYWSRTNKALALATSRAMGRAL